MLNSNYLVKEIHLTLQGEGINTGLPVVLVRFTGCNLDCKFCDTDFVGTNGPGGGEFHSAISLVDKIESFWPSCNLRPNVLFTGGEPLLQLDQILLEELKRRNHFILVETNGTLIAPSLIDWVTVSPKSNAPLQRTGDEVKIVWPQDNIDLTVFEECNFSYFWLQPKFDPCYQSNLQECIAYCLHHPKWRLSVQTHRILGID